MFYRLCFSQVTDFIFSPILMLGIEELKITVVDSNWSLRHRQITSLNVKYLAIWSVDLE